MDLPCAFVVEESIRSLLVLLCDVFGLFVALEPRLILLVETPTLAFKRLRSKVLLIGPLSIVEGVKQSISIYPAV